MLRANCTSHAKIFGQTGDIDRSIIQTQHPRIAMKFAKASNISLPALLKIGKLRRRCVTIKKNIARKPTCECGIVLITMNRSCFRGTNCINMPNLISSRGHSASGTRLISLLRFTQHYIPRNIIGKRESAKVSSPVTGVTTLRVSHRV